MGFLRKIFGPSTNEVWEEFAHEIDGDFIRGGFNRASAIKGYHKNWVIVVDTFTTSSQNNSTNYTRIRAPYVNRDDFQFRIYRKHGFTRLGEFFGMKDIEIGFPEFDKDFFIKGNDVDKLRALFENDAIRELIDFQPRILLEVRTGDKWFQERLPKGVNEVYLQVVGVIKDKVRLHDLYDLYIELLEQLYVIGTAEEDSPSAVS